MSNYEVKLYRDSQITTDRILAQQAVERLAIPDRTAVVFSDASGGAPFFTTVSAAVAYATSLSPSRSNPVYADANDIPYDLTDYYTNYDNGIVMESPYDVWRSFVFNGGDLNLANLLYPVELERVKFTINL
jgi:hypothetical protein